MRKRGSVRRRRRIGTAWLLRGLLLFTAAAGFGLISWSQGWLALGRTHAHGRPPGTMAVPAAAVPIPTYARVRLEDLIDPRTGTVRAVYLPEGSVLPDTFVDAKQILGRVLAVDKAPGQLFSENDFFPPGTREGIVAGIPQGKRALRIDASKVNGIVGLGRGDRFDLVATFDIARQGSGGVTVEGASANELGALGSRMRATTIVEDGAVVQPLETRTVVAGQRPQLVEEMVIAVASEEVAALTEALHTKARIDCVPRSGRPADVSSGPETHTESRPPGLRMVETISGGQRRVIAVPSADAGPTPQGG